MAKTISAIYKTQGNQAIASRNAFRLLRHFS